MLLPTNFAQPSPLARIALVGAVLLVGCASTSLDIASKEARDAADKAQAEASGHFMNKNFRQAATTMNRAITLRTESGQFANGKDAHYAEIAKMHSQVASYHLMDGDIRPAAQAWRQAFNEVIQGEANAHAKQRDGEEANALIGMITVGVIGAYAASRAPDQASAQKMMQQTTKAMDSFQSALSSAVKVPVELVRPADGVYRIPVSVHHEPLNRIYRLRSPNSYCTAFAVSQRVFLTNAHCVTSNKGQTVRSPGELTLVSEKEIPGTRAAEFGNQKLAISYFVTHAGNNQGYDGRFENDWAILVVDKVKSKYGAFAFPIWFKEFADDAAAVVTPDSTELMLGGYSSDLVSGHYVTLHWGCKATRLGAEIHSNCESEKGSSGSPVMLAKPPFTLLGINAGTYSRTNLSTGEKSETHVHVNIRQFVKPLREVLARES